MICTQPNERKHKILHVIIPFFPFFPLSTFDMMKKGNISKLVQLLISWIFDLCGNYDTKRQLYQRTSAVSCLPEYPKNAQGHTYCEQSSHGLYTPRGESTFKKQPSVEFKVFFNTLCCKCWLCWGIFLCDNTNGANLNNAVFAMFLCTCSTFMCPYSARNYCINSVASNVSSGMSVWQYVT